MYLTTTSSTDRQFLQGLIARAKEREAAYEWVAASSIYEEASRRESIHDPLEKGKITELLARSWFKGAFQADSRQEFRRRTNLAVDSYETAASFYDKANSEARAKRAKARSLHARFWLEEDLVERRSILEKCISLVEESASLFQAVAELQEAAEVHKELPLYLLEALSLAQDRSHWAEYEEKGLRTAEILIGELPSLRDDEGLVESLNLTIILYLYLAVEPEEFLQQMKKIGLLLKQMEEIVERTRTPYTLLLLKEAEGLSALFKGEESSALSFFETGLAEAEAVKDIFLKARLLFGAVLAASDKGRKSENLDITRRTFQELQSFWSDSVKSLTILTPGGVRNFILDRVYGRYADYHTIWALAEVEADRKKELLGQAITNAKGGLAFSDKAPFLRDCLHAWSKALYFLATLQDDLEKKAMMLREALLLREESVRGAEIVGPRSWSLGVDRNYLALLKAELSSIESDPEKKIELLQSAVVEMGQCIDVCREWAILPDLTWGFSTYEEWYGDILFKLYHLIMEPTVAQHAVHIYKETLEYQTKLGRVGSEASIWWKLASIHDSLGEYSEAADAFRRASENYKLGANKIPPSAIMFSQIASYMDAWSLIEEARLHHNNEKYMEAAENYAKAANILRQTPGYDHLFTHYLACELLERGEAASREEKPDEAGEYFASAVRSFDESRLELERKLKKSQGPQEKKELENWVGITLGRERYCGGRIKLEKARLLDKRGEKEASSTEYYSASEVFNALAKAAPIEQARRELDTLKLFCEAWSKMKDGEAKVAPELYEEAAEIFLKTEKLAPREKTRLLAMANFSICKALASGTLFRRTRNTRLYSEIKKQLETAADYYQEGGFRNAEKWTRATSRLFDALVYIADAESEKEPKKKTELFHLAEKHLQLSARLYGQAGFSKKEEEAMRYLEKAREEKELLLTPLDALSDNPPTASPVTPVSLVRDQSVGLEKFETARVVGRASVVEKEIGVGSPLVVELEMANVGKTSALLLKLENLVSEGLEFDRDRLTDKVAEGNIDLKGKRLDYLKTHEIKVPMKATRKGSFQLKPKVIFVDEKGNHMSYEFAPAAITVKELGISGWLKGPK